MHITTSNTRYMRYAFTIYLSMAMFAVNVCVKIHKKGNERIYFALNCIFDLSEGRKSYKRIYIQYIEQTKDNIQIFLPQFFLSFFLFFRWGNKTEINDKSGTNEIDMKRLPNAPTSHKNKRNTVKKKTNGVVCCRCKMGRD